MILFFAPSATKPHNVSLTDSSGNEVKGTWYAQGNGNRWIFDGSLIDGASYTLTVNNTAADKNGTTIASGTTVTFTR